MQAFVRQAMDGSFEADLFALEGWLHAPEHLRRQPGEALVVEARNEVRAIPRVADDPT